MQSKSGATVPPALPGTLEGLITELLFIFSFDSIIFLYHYLDSNIQEASRGSSWYRRALSLDTQASTFPSGSHAALGLLEKGSLWRPILING